MCLINQIYDEVILAKTIDGLIVIIDGHDKLKKDIKNKDVIIHDSNKLIQNGIYSTSLFLYRYVNKDESAFSEGIIYFSIMSSIQVIDGWKFFTTDKSILDSTEDIPDTEIASTSANNFILGITTQDPTIESKFIDDKIMQDNIPLNTFTIQNNSNQVISNDTDFKLIKELKDWIKNEININILEIKNEIKESIKNECIDKSKKEYNNSSKLNKEQVIEIKKLIKEGKKIKEIIKMFPVGKTAISNIKCGITWKNVII